MKPFSHSIYKLLTYSQTASPETSFPLVIKFVSIVSPFSGSLHIQSSDDS